jgi:Cu(I)/Ag(I) efflux system membrane protein CusA/SilA
MIARLIEAVVRNRLLVIVLTVMVSLVGARALLTTPVDAIPDLSDVQVIVYTDYPGQAPQVVEDQVTYPLTTAMLSVPYATTVRGYSYFGFSLVYVIFQDGTDLYWARSRVLEYLNFAKARLPGGVAPQLGPDATGVGWVYEYSLSDFGPRAHVLRQKLDADHDGRVSEGELPRPADVSVAGGRRVPVYSEAQLADLFSTPHPPGPAKPAAFVHDSLEYVETFDRDRDGRISRAELGRAANFSGIDLAQLRSLQDWYLRYDLMSVPGVSEVASVGGFVRQYQVDLDPDKARAFGVTLDRVKRAIRRSNIDVGGRVVEMSETEYMVRGKGYIRSLDDLRTVPVGVNEVTHTPIYLSQVANIHYGPEIRRGLTDENGQGEVATGVVVMRFGENALDVIRNVKARLAQLKLGLPEGVEVHTDYDRSGLIERAIHTLSHKLLEEMLVVAIVCVLFLLHFRSAFVAIFTLPVGILMSFIVMRLVGVNANIMSLGGIAIAIGVMVDASVVMVENLHKHKEREGGKSHLELVIAASKEVGPALFFSLLVVTVSFLPVFTLQAQEGRLFRPLAYTKTFALGSASLLSVTIIPVLMYYFVRGKIPRERANPINRFFLWIYRPVIRVVLDRPWAVLTVAAAILAITVLPWSRLGSEFMPPLNEGDLLYMPTTPPGISITKAKELLEQTDRIIASHPQVAHVLGKIGRAETATDPAPLSMMETTIVLTPEDTWPKGKTIEDIIHELDAMVHFPGVTNAWTMPIKTRIDMLATGIKTPVGIKLLGSNLAQLAKVGEQIEGVLRQDPETQSVYAERAVGGHYVDVVVRRQDAARFGLTVADVEDVVSSAIGGMNVTETVEGLERYPVNVRYPRELRNNLEKLARVAVPTPMGHTVPLASVADIRLTNGPPAIKSEDARPSAWIYVDLKTSDIGGYVRRAQALVDRRVALPQGVSMVWSGQFEYMQRANRRLAVVVPLTLAIILLLLFFHFRNFSESLIVMLTLPFALVGGVWLMWALHYNVSVAVGVGFIALAGVAAETGVVMLVYLDEAHERWRSEGRLKCLADLKPIIIEGAVDRVRPKLMTVAVILFGLLPVMHGQQTGSRVMKRIAAPMVGGIISSTVLTLVLIPAVYLLWKRFAHRKELPPTVEPDDGPAGPPIEGAGVR